jgi:hypothetical protein
MNFPTFQAELRQIAGHVQAFAAARLPLSKR